MKQFVKQLLTAIFTAQMKRIIALHQPKIIAVVGSVGKTSTKFAIATVLAERYRVLSQAGNYNAPISVPFIFLNRSLPNLYNPFGWFAAWLAGNKIIRGDFPYDVVVVEIGTDKPGDVVEFKDILRPDISVVTAVSDEHMEFFGTLDAVAKEELSVSEFSNTLVLNVDDIDADFIEKYVSNDAKLHAYGEASDENSFKSKSSATGSKVTLSLDFGKHAVSFESPLIALHSFKTVLAATVVGQLMGMTNEELSAGAAKVTSPPGRMQLLKGINNSMVIDDSYNASPLAVAAALAALYSVKTPQRIVLLGNMNELGETSQASHEKIGALCDPKQLDLVVTLGPDVNTYAAPIAEANGCKVITTASPYEAGKIIAENVKEGGVVLVKGSQNRVFSEEAIKVLLADPADIRKLVRQSDFWLAKKRQQFSDYPG